MHQAATSSITSFERFDRESQDFKSQVPGVAESWQVRRDGEAYTFHVQTFNHSNDPVTAGDFEYAWKRVINPETGMTTTQGSSSVIEGAQAYNEGKGAQTKLGSSG